MTKRAYYSSNELSLVAKVLDIGRDELGAWVVPDETLAHVRGGGQKGDRGTIGGIHFNDVVGCDGRSGPAKHYVDGEPTIAVGDIVEIVVDAEWRRAQAARHAAGHLIAALFEEMCATLKAVGAHHYPGEARVEFVGEFSRGENDFAAKLQAASRDAVEHDLPIRIVGNPFENRAIQIGEYPPIPCGGTHPTSTGQIGCVNIRGIKVKGSKLRVSYEVSTPK